jgi:hypothetical protein
MWLEPVGNECLHGSEIEDPVPSAFLYSYRFNRTRLLVDVQNEHPAPSHGSVSSFIRIIRSLLFPKITGKQHALVELWDFASKTAAAKSESYDGDYQE